MYWVVYDVLEAIDASSLMSAMSGIPRDVVSELLDLGADALIDLEGSF